jgi:putative transposase
MKTKDSRPEIQKYMPAAEKVAEELGKAQSIDDFFGKKGIFSRLFSNTIEKMVEAELTDHLGYDKHSSSGDNSGNSRNGSYRRNLRTSVGDTPVEVARDRNGEFKPKLLKKYETSSNEIEDKITAMYARGMSVSDIQSMLTDMYGIDISTTLISTITGKIMPLIESWQNRPLEQIYPIIYLDCIHVKLKKEHRIQTIAVYICLAVDMEGHKDVLGHWIGDGAEGANFWLSVITDLQQRGVTDILIAAVDGLSGFIDAIHAIYPKTMVQRCIIHQIRNSLKYVSWKDKKTFMTDLKAVYQAVNKQEAETALLTLSEKWSNKYRIAIKSWENNWDDLTTYFEFPDDIRRLMYTTNTIESYNRQLRKVIKSKSIFPTEESIRKMLYLATQDILRKWTMPIYNWHRILNQLSIRFEDRLST